MSKLHRKIFFRPTHQLWLWLGRTLTTMLCISGFVDDVMCPHNRPDEGDANRVYTDSDSPGYLVVHIRQSLMYSIVLFHLWGGN